MTSACHGVFNRGTEYWFKALPSSWTWTSNWDSLLNRIGLWSTYRASAQAISCLARSWDERRPCWPCCFLGAESVHNYLSFIMPVYSLVLQTLKPADQQNCSSFLGRCDLESWCATDYGVCRNCIVYKVIQCHHPGHTNVDGCKASTRSYLRLELSRAVITTYP